MSGRPPDFSPEPLIFLTRELRRRHAQEYHNAAHLREAVFRQDLYALFDDRRFVRSARRVELRRTGGDARTDLDALIFNRKTGTLGIFELKSQDLSPARPPGGIRQRDYFLQANRQVAATVNWLQGSTAATRCYRAWTGPTAKKFRVQRVRHFVLGATSPTSPAVPGTTGVRPGAPGRRCSRSSGMDPSTPTRRNPLGALFARLRDATPPSAPANADSQTIAVGDLRLRIYPSFAAMRVSGGSPGVAAWRWAASCPTGAQPFR